MPDIFTRHKKKDPTNESKPVQTSPQPENKSKDTANSIKSNTNRLSLISTFCQNPLGVALVGQDHDENVLLFLRQDFITNLPWILYAIFFALLPIFISPILSFASLSLDFLPYRFIILIISFYYLLLAGYAFANFVTWFYTIGVISTKKFMDIDFRNLSSIHVGTVNLKDASDAKYKQTGFFQSFFDYGDIIVTIEATKEQFIFEKTPRPALISDLLSDLIGKE